MQRCISGGWNREVSLYTKVSSFQGVRFHGMQRCPRFRGKVYIHVHLPVRHN